MSGSNKYPADDFGPAAQNRVRDGFDACIQRDCKTDDERGKLIVLRDISVAMMAAMDRPNVPLTRRLADLSASLMPAWALTVVPTLDHDPDFLGMVFRQTVERFARDLMREFSSHTNGAFDGKIAVEVVAPGALAKKGESLVEAVNAALESLVDGCSCPRCTAKREAETASKGRPH